MHHKTKKISFRNQTVTINNVGGICSDWQIKLLDRTITPFYRAPWIKKVVIENPMLPHEQTHNSEEEQSIDLLSNLQGIFACIPFGGTDSDLYLHGAPAANYWTFDEGGRDFQSLTYYFELSQQPLLEKVNQHVQLSHDGLTIKLTLYPLVDCQMPVGFHPMFAIPDGGLTIVPPDFKNGFTYLKDIMLEKSSFFKNGRTFTSLTKVPNSFGGMTNGCQLPLNRKCEQIVQLVDTNGQCKLIATEQKWGVCMKWDVTQLPHLLLWYSNYGRVVAPWNERNLCLGVEPIASAFDLGTKASLRPPFKSQGQTYLSLKKGIPQELMLTLTFFEDK